MIRYPASWFTANNPCLGLGQFGLETDTGKIKVGNGTSPWTSLLYLPAANAAAPAPAPAPSPAPSAVTLTGPTSGTAGSASAAFTATLNQTATSAVVVTPVATGNAGVFNPTSITIAIGQLSGTATFTATAAGTTTVTETNNAGLTNNGSVIYVAAAATGAGPTTVSFTGPTSGTAGTASSVFTATLNQPATSAVVVTPVATGNAGTFSPSTITIGVGQTTGTATFTATAAGTTTVTETNNAGLTNSGSVTFVAAAPAVVMVFATDRSQGMGQGSTGLSATTITQMTARIGFTVNKNGAKNMRAVFSPHYLSPIYSTSPNAFQVKHTVEAAGGVAQTPALFAGSASKTIQPTDGLIVSDIIGTYPATTTFETKTEPVITLGQQFPVGINRYPTGNTVEAIATSAASTPTSQVNTPGLPSLSGEYSSAVYGYTPIAYICEQTTYAPSIGWLGNSIDDATSYDIASPPADGNIGFVGRALHAANLGGCKATRGSNRLNLMVFDPTTAPSGNASPNQYALMAYANNVGVGDCTNDMVNGDSNATIQANYVKVWTSIKAVNPSIKIRARPTFPRVTLTNPPASITASGTTATLTVAAGNKAPPVGGTVIVAGVTPAAYNGTFTIATSTGVVGGSFTFTTLTAPGGPATVLGTWADNSSRLENQNPVAGFEPGTTSNRYLNNQFLASKQADGTITEYMDWMLPLVESSPNSGKWIEGYTIEGTHPNSTGHIAVGNPLATRMANW